MIKNIFENIVNFSKNSFQIHYDGTMRWVVYSNDQSGHRKFTLYYEDLCQ
jgi:hypothetical protein